MFRNFSFQMWMDNRRDNSLHAVKLNKYSHSALGRFSRNMDTKSKRLQIKTSTIPCFPGMP